MAIGERIKARRLELGLSVDDLAAKLKKNRATVYRYESNDIENFPTTVLEPLAKALRTTPARLMGWDEGTVQEESNISADSCDNRRLEHYERKMLNTFSRLTNDNKEKAISYTENLYNIQQLDTEQETLLNAAHGRTDINIPEGIDTSDDDVMDDENF